jgi:hypothetical protein
VVTGNHPIWVKGYIGSGRQYNELNIWETARDLGKEEYLFGWGAVLALQDNRFVNVIDHGGLLMRSDMPDMGIVNVGDIHESCEGQGIDFSKSAPELSDYIELNLDDQTYPDNDAPDGSVGSLGFGFPPLLRKVYNLEVEENHTYYVGELGVLVHNTSASVLVDKSLPQKPSEALGVFFDDGYIKNLKAAINKALSEGKNAIAVAKDINRYTEGGKFQELFDGSIADLNAQVKELMAYALGYVNVVTGKADGSGTALNYVALGGCPRIETKDYSTRIPFSPIFMQNLEKLQLIL